MKSLTSYESLTDKLFTRSLPSELSKLDFGSFLLDAFMAVRFLTDSQLSLVFEYLYSSSTVYVTDSEAGKL